eukprot:353424-Chlamydomonas_euryale.AAC.6
MSTPSASRLSRRSAPGMPPSPETRTRARAEKTALCSANFGACRSGNDGGASLGLAWHDERVQ